MTFSNTSATKIITRGIKGIKDFPSAYKKPFKMKDGKEIKLHIKSIIDKNPLALSSLNRTYIIENKLNKVKPIV